MLLVAILALGSQFLADLKANADDDTITIGLSADLRTADFLNNREFISRTIMGSTVYDALFTTDEKGNSVPSLAVKAEPSADLKTWTFTLREGVKFQDGKTFTAKDVVACLDAIRDPKNASELASDLGSVVSYKADGDYKVIFTVKSPDAEFYTLFTDTFFIQDMDHFDKEHPIGTGPYEWDSRVVGDRTSFKRFDGYWRGKPPFAHVVFRYIPDPQVAALELQNGGVDMLHNDVSMYALDSLKSNPDLDVYHVPGNTLIQGYLNMEKARNGGYKDALAVRQGLAYFWNAQKYVPAIVGGAGEVASQILPPWQLGYDPDIKVWPYDPDKGAALLAKGGINKGDPIKLLVYERPYLCDLATALQSDLKAHGYDAQVQCLAPEAAPAEVAKYQWDVLYFNTSGRSTAMAMYRDRWLSRLAPTPQQKDVRTYKSDEVDALVAKMGQTTDRDAYEKLSQQVSQDILVKDVAVLPLYWENVYVAAQKKVQDVKVSPLAWYPLLMNAMTTVKFAN
ncbi:MAG TPA: ABC transporter substrate-binding protein [Dongiaceae bacterium]|nr:ABC transporter substrate-binding protein [Dongiaceae bacterium]